MPHQPLSSRLSLAQAYVSTNSRKKAVSIGLESGKSAEEEGWGQGNPVVKVMGKDIRVMKRWGYDWKEMEEKATNGSNENDESDELNADDASEEPALWGLDTEALKKSQKTSVTSSEPGANMPIYVPQSARAYILKSFDTPGNSNASASSKSTVAPSEKAAEKERNLGLLLAALDLLYQSWASFLSTDELDRRSWSWYIKVRPEVADGVAGWSGKGEVKLSSILDLRRST